MTHMQGDTHSPRRRRMAGCRAVAILAGCSAALAGCASAPPPPPPTVINITMTAAPDVNPDSQGTASPLQLRIYQLGSAANFNNAEFFPVYRKDAATLGTDIVKREDFELSPGTSKSESLKPDAPVKAIGVFGGYIDYQNAAWRGSADIMANRTTDIVIAAGAHGLTVKSTTEPPPKPAS